MAMHIKRLATFRMLAKGENSTASKHTVGMFLLEVQGAERQLAVLSFTFT